SITCFTASARNSSVYCLLLPINTSVIAINYGNRMSTKGWPVQSFSLALLTQRRTRQCFSLAAESPLLVAHSFSLARQSFPLARPS
ncbi:hypothetical protein, partial [Pseudoxanthomonas japonensis]|uniref:hypothetical protein n=1 Tax=Pseudoxanthomonas japonensis TaxID=69284 RepID=UPI003CCD7367